MHYTSTTDICCFVLFSCPCLCVQLLKSCKLQKWYFVTLFLLNPSCQEWMIYECCYSRRHSPLLLPLRFYSLVWIITVTNSSCSRMAFWIEREGESASEREAAIERREAWEINSSELTLRGPGTAEYCSSGGEMGRWRGWGGGAKGKKSLCSQRNELDDLRGAGGGSPFLAPDNQN